MDSTEIRAKILTDDYLTGLRKLYSAGKIEHEPKNVGQEASDIHKFVPGNLLPYDLASKVAGCWSTTAAVNEIRDYLLRLRE